METSAINTTTTITNQKTHTTLQGECQKAVDLFIGFFIPAQIFKSACQFVSSSYMSQITVFPRSVLDFENQMFFNNCGKQTFEGTWLSCSAKFGEAKTGSLRNQKWDKTQVVFCRLILLHI